MNIKELKYILKETRKSKERIIEVKKYINRLENEVKVHKEYLHNIYGSVDPLGWASYSPVAALSASRLYELIMESLEKKNA